MKRLLLVTPFFPPQHAAASLRTASFASAWSELGADVTVLTTKKRHDQQGMHLYSQVLMSRRFLLRSRIC